MTRVPRKEKTNSKGQNQNMHLATYARKDQSIFDKNGVRNRAELQAWADGPTTTQLVPRSQSHPKFSTSTADKSPLGSPKKSPRSKLRPFSDASLSSTDSRVLWRSLQERNRNPTKLNFERKRLTRCFQVKKEPELEVINYQHNAIELIEFVSGFKKLVFLDFYDNRIEEVSGLEKLPSLKVLLLGKNQIRHISGLNHLPTLDMLDLHSNLISKIENLNHLKLLRVLNLSGNFLTKVQNLSGLDSLVELNLRRNKINTIVDLENVPQLQKLFLSYNELNSLESLLERLKPCVSLSELTLDGNPLCQTQNYKTTVLKTMSNLKQLDMRRITDSEREVILKALQKDKERERKAIEQAEKEQDRTNRIMAAQTLWETQQLQLPPVNANERLRLSDTLASDFETERTVLFGKLKPSGAGEQGYAEILGNLLKFYGKDSLGALEKNWGYAAMTNVTAAKFKFVDFDYVAQTFTRLKIKFPHILTLILSHANLRTLQQLHHLHKLKNLHKLVVIPDGNPLYHFTIWKEYAAFMLAAEIDLKFINEQEITEVFLDRSRTLFAPLKTTVAKLNPTTRMIALNCGGNLDKKETFQDMKLLGAKQLLCLVSDGKKSANFKKLEESEHHSRHLIRECLHQSETEIHIEANISELFPAVFEEFVSNVAADITKYDAETYMKSRMQAFAQWNKSQKQ